MNKNYMDNKLNKSGKKNKVKSKEDKEDKVKKVEKVKNKYIALFVLHGLAGIIGFKNGDWKKNTGKTITIELVNEYIYEFIHLGGINGLDIKNWKLPDSPLFHIATAKTMLSFDNSSWEKTYIKNYDPKSYNDISDVPSFIGKFDSKFLINAKNELIVVYNQIVEEIDDSKLDRLMDKIIMKNILNFTDETDATDKPYDIMSGGSGAAAKGLCIGICLFGKKNRDKLIDISIRIAQITHNSPLGFLGGLIVALFAAFSIEGIKLETWPFEVLKILQSIRVKMHIGLENFDKIQDYLTFLKYWNTYIETRFDINKKPIYTKSIQNPVLRMRYYSEHFIKDFPIFSIGSNGLSSCIIAYDCLLDCKGNWEKLIIYSVLHPGEGDIIGGICGGLYGLLYGFGDVPEQMIKTMEGFNEFKEIGEKLYKKFYIF